MRDEEKKKNRLHFSEARCQGGDCSKDPITHKYDSRHHIKMGERDNEFEKNSKRAK